jgi:predicted nuclease of predicted toxin-antitoxin system
VREIGLHAAADREILSRAESEGRTCVTLDKDFHEALARTGAERPSVVLLRWQNLRAKDLVPVLEMVWDRFEQALPDGVAITVSERAMRIRRLPIGRGPQ